MAEFTVKSPPLYEVDTSLLEMANESLQAHERFHLKLRRSDQHSQEVKKDVSLVLDKLREIKSQVEGSHFDFEPTLLNEVELVLLELKLLTLMHVPTSVTEEVKVKFNRLLSQLFDGRCEEIVSSILLTCPWYWATQRERGEQARRNVLLVIYVCHDDQFLSSANPHIRDQSNVLDHGWLVAVELYHFVHCMVKGKSRFVEALFCPEGALLHNTQHWRTLRETTRHTLLMGLRGFVEQCRGQAIGGIAKKRKTGKMGLKSSVTFADFCESFRLLHNAYHVSTRMPPHTGEVDVASLPALAKEGLEKLVLLNKEPDLFKPDIFDIIMKWRDEINESLKNFKFTNPQEVERIMGEWMSKVRLRGRTLAPPAEVTGDDYSRLIRHMERIGGPIKAMRPEHILMIAQAGSFMYGLSTPDSDVDFVIVYREPTPTILSTCKRLSEIVESRGPQKSFEYGAYEARTFCEMLLKGSVVILELVFMSDLEYTSPAWKALADKRQLFVTEKGIQQYLGLIKNNFNMIANEKHVGTSRDRKLFYQIFHKLDSLEYMCQGRPPPVKCSGEIQEFIMRVRTGAMEGEFTRENLHALAKEKYETFRDKLASRKTRLPENADYRFVTNWLMSVRGWQ